MENIKNKDSDTILKELSPHLEVMARWYNDFVATLLKDGQELDDAEDAASLMAVAMGLGTARQTHEVSESVEQIYYAQKMFHVFMSMRKLIDMGYIDATEVGTDENGWPMYKAANVKPVNESEDE